VQPLRDNRRASLDGQKKPALRGASALRRSSAEVIASSAMPVVGEPFKRLSYFLESVAAVESLMIGFYVRPERPAMG